MTVNKAVIPAAGMGTRFLPATKSMPKEMLPIIDKPVLQYVIEEAVACGITDILVVTGRGKRAIENHFDYNPELEAFLKANGKEDLIDRVRSIADLANIHYVRQKEQRGLGDAIALAHDHVGEEPFAVLLGDTIIQPHDGEQPGLRQLLNVYEKLQGSVVAVHRVPEQWVSRYGIVDGSPLNGNDDLLDLKQLVEKPPVDRAPTNLAIAGRYVFNHQIFDCLKHTGRGVGGEIQLTDAMNLLAGEQKMYALAWQARRFDIGNRLEYVRCFIDFALKREDIADEIRKHIEVLLHV